MSEKQGMHLKGRLKLYMQWPVVMSVILIAMTGWIYYIDHKAGMLMAACVLIYLVVTVSLYFYNKSTLMRALVEFAAQYGAMQNRLLKELEMPYGILLENGRIL